MQSIGEARILSSLSFSGILRSAYYWPFFRGTQRKFSENVCSKDDLRSRISGTFVVKFLACIPLLGFSNI